MIRTVVARGTVQNAGAALQVLNEIVSIIRSRDQDLTWTSYDSLEQLLADLERHISRLSSGDTAAMNELRLLFAPTGSLQELSIANGWGDAFLALASRFDRAAGG